MDRYESESAAIIAVLVNNCTAIFAAIQSLRSANKAGRTTGPVLRCAHSGQFVSPFSALSLGIRSSVLGLDSANRCWRAKRRFGRIRAECKSHLNFTDTFGARFE